MTPPTRSGTHVLATVVDQFGAHHECSCRMFSMPADHRKVVEGSAETFIAAPDQQRVLARWRDHLHALRIVPTRRAA